MNVQPRKERATFSIDSAVKERLDTQIPKSRRSSFVEQAIAEALRKQAVESLAETLDRIGAYSTGGEDSVELLRRLRLERNEQLMSRHRR